MTDEDREGRTGSGFVSRDNDDPTAEAIFNFMRGAGVPRRSTVLWNAVPWWNGTRRITREELGHGIEAIRGLIALLPELKVIVLVGGRAQRAAQQLARFEVAVLQSAHPSPIVRATRPMIWKAIPQQWAAVLPLIK